MITINVEVASSKEFGGKNGRQPFTVYSVASGGTWYQLYGKGKEAVKRGDEITGEVEVKEYTRKDGTRGTSNVFRLQDPVITDILKRLSILENLVLKPVSEQTPKTDSKTLITDNKPNVEKGDKDTYRTDNPPKEQIRHSADFLAKCKKYCIEMGDDYYTTLNDFGKGVYRSGRDIPTEKEDDFITALKEKKASIKDGIPF